MVTLHGAGYGHGDIRWENVISISSSKYVLIDLEGGVRLGSGCVTPYPKAWRDGAVLVDGKYEVTSDLQQVANLFAGLPLGHDASEVESRLRQHGATAKYVLQEKWFSV